MPVDTLYPIAGRAELSGAQEARADFAGDGQRRCSGFSLVLQDLKRELGRVEGRLETMESTFREHLKRERLRAERERVEELRRKLEAERSRGFWSRLLGG